MKGVDFVALNRDTHTSQTAILPNDVNKVVVQLAKDNERSVSAQIVYMLKQQLKEDSK
jgi:hypothetical protein